VTGLHQRRELLKNIDALSQFESAWRVRTNEGEDAVKRASFWTSILFIVAGPDGALWLTDSTGITTGPDGPRYTITTIAGNGSADFPLGDNGPATDAAMVPKGVAIDSLGDLFLIDAGSVSGQRQPAVREVDTAGVITTIACDGPDPLGVTPWGPRLPAHQALCGNLAGVAVDNSGNVFVTQSGGRTLDWLDTSGIISILSSDVNGPQNVAVDGAGNVYVADAGNCRILETDISGASLIVAGMDGSCGYSGDDGPATSAQLLFPQGVAVDGAGNVYIADTNNARVRKVDASGVITTVAGSGCTVFGGGDGGPAVSASLCYPVGVAVDGAGNLYIAESSASLIRRVDTSGIITTIAGGGTDGLGDGGPATSARLLFPYSVAVGPAGTLYVADSGDFRVRLLTPVDAIAVANVRRR
jgi:hypothetical protein